MINKRSLKQDHVYLQDLQATIPTIENHLNGQIREEIEKHSNDEQRNEVENESLIIYKVYYDRRMNPPRFRILANNQCTNVGPNLSFDGLTIRTVKVEAIEGECPWAWAPGCEWSAHHFLSEVFTGFPPNQVNLTRNGKWVTVPVSRVPESYRDGYTICTAPLYWYSDWLRLILFFEISMLHGATNFVMSTHSVSRKVQIVLDFYKDKGILSLRSWPLMPSSFLLDPNDSIYRLSHSLSHLDCTFRVDTKIASLNDIDEFIIPRNGKAIDFFRKLFSNHSHYKGATFRHAELRLFSNHSHYKGATFRHAELRLFNPLRLENTTRFDLSGLKNLTLLQHDGPGKAVFMPEYTRNLKTHQVSKYFNKKHRTLKVKKSDAILLHTRYNFREMSEKWLALDFPVNVFPSISSDHFVKRVDSVILKIFNGNRPEYSDLSNRLLGNCLKHWTEKQCKTPIHSCWEILKPLDEWLFADPQPDSRYYVL
ncbi:unnamed protein product, partial [Mesorhabditis belari]|uniref:Glycosyltransferase family 92 protein n=1 Tax=Mesorhabditis belari TaxID=2138241 RepID=A0AAF3F7G1_9BILA